MVVTYGLGVVTRAAIWVVTVEVLVVTVVKLVVLVVVVLVVDVVVEVNVMLVVIVVVGIVSTEMSLHAPYKTRVKALRAMPSMTPQKHTDFCGLHW